ncbi:hypothetical protein LDENG_00274540 [Lucifuga dentata]|nr:hypothetical protein LDENG_00274540 [Lucifuga dentata]
MSDQNCPMVVHWLMKVSIIGLLRAPPFSSNPNLLWILWEWWVQTVRDGTGRNNVKVALCLCFESECLACCGCRGENHHTGICRC